MLNGFENVQTNVWKIGQVTVRGTTHFFITKTVGSLNVKRHDSRYFENGQLWTTTNPSFAECKVKKLNGN